MNDSVVGGVTHYYDTTAPLRGLAEMQLSYVVYRHDIVVMIHDDIADDYCWVTVHTLQPAVPATANITLQCTAGDGPVNTGTLI